VGPTDWRDVVRRVENEGFSTLLVADHFVAPMACGPLILGAALASTTLRVGSYVFDNDFRHPAVMAKEMATIDVLSKGRVELGLGAGWLKPEYDAIGLPFDPPDVRVARLEEAVEVIGRLLDGDIVTHRGRHYQLSDYQGTPRPAQSRIPLLIGGGGPRIIRLAARRADIASFTPRTLLDGSVDSSDVGPHAMDAKVAALDGAITQAGRSDDEVERNVLLFAVSPSLAGVASFPWTRPEEALTSPFALIGETNAMVETLYERRERWGLSYFVCFQQGLEALIPVVRRLAGAP
jgi:probable F420-dependent oxidoreductase